MPDNLLKSVQDLPDVSFIDNDSLSAIMQRLVANYEKRYREITGENISLGQADPMRIQLYAIALDLYQIEKYVDRAGKQDLLKYSYGEFLDHLASNRGVTRHGAAAARTTVRFMLSDVRPHVVTIPAGVRITSDDKIYFATTSDLDIPEGAKYGDVEAVCTVEGSQGNNFLPGQLKKLADPQGFVASVENITTTAGGTRLEDDASLAERVYLAPSGYSTAGPDGAYVYWAKTFNTELGSVKVSSPRPCEVVIYALMRDGTLPPTELLSGLEKFLRTSEIRPLTDFVKVATPKVKPFELDFSYYIADSDRLAISSIQKRVEQAAAEFVSWQTREIGKDINPTELIKLVREAGAKRLEIRAPNFTSVADVEVAQLENSPRVIYGGVEDD